MLPMRSVINLCIVATQFTAKTWAACFEAVRYCCCCTVIVDVDFGYAALACVFCFVLDIEACFL